MKIDRLFMVWYWSWLSGMFLIVSILYYFTINQLTALALFGLFLACLVVAIKDIKIIQLEINQLEGK
jgi:hypothetical protein